jgi:hypothetical protein
MALDATALDQIVAVGRASTRDRDKRAIEWARELQVSLHKAPEDLTVQVKLTPDGCWHKKAIGGKHTACGRPLGGFASRDETYAGELCESCFTTFELIELSRLANDDDLQPADMTSIYDEEGTYPWRKR